MGNCVFQCDFPHQWIAQWQVVSLSVYCDGAAFLCSSTLLKVPLLQAGTVAIWPQMFKSEVKPHPTNKQIALPEDPHGEMWRAVRGSLHGTAKRECWAFWLVVTGSANFTPPKWLGISPCDHGDLGGHVFVDLGSYKNKTTNQMINAWHYGGVVVCVHITSIPEIMWFKWHQLVFYVLSYQRVE